MPDLVTSSSSSSRSDPSPSQVSTTSPLPPISTSLTSTLTGSTSYTSSCLPVEDSTLSQFLVSPDSLACSHSTTSSSSPTSSSRLPNRIPQASTLQLSAPPNEIFNSYSPPRAAPESMVLDFLHDPLPPLPSNFAWTALSTGIAQLEEGEKGKRRRKPVVKFGTAGHSTLMRQLSGSLGEDDDPAPQGTERDDGRVQGDGEWVQGSSKDLERAEYQEDDWSMGEESERESEEREESDDNDKDYSAKKSKGRRKGKARGREKRNGKARKQARDTEFKERLARAGEGDLWDKNPMTADEYEGTSGYPYATGAGFAAMLTSGPQVTDAEMSKRYLLSLIETLRNPSTSAKVTPLDPISELEVLQEIVESLGRPRIGKEHFVESVCDSSNRLFSFPASPTDVF